MAKADEALQAAFNADPNAMQSLIANRIPCNQELADDPFVIVDSCIVLPPGHFQVGALGIVNAVLAANGMPLVAAMFSDEPNAFGHHRLVGFCEYKPVSDAELKERRRKDNQRLVSAGAEYMMAEDQQGDTKTGWWQDGVFLGKDERTAVEGLFGG